MLWLLTSSGCGGAAGRAWSLSEGELRDSVVEMARLRSRVEAAYLAVVKVLDERPEAVPGAPLDRAAATFLQQRLHLDPGRANADVRAAHTLDPDDGALPEVGAALAAGDITRDHADVCVRAAARLPKRLLTTVVEHAETGLPITGMDAVDRWLAQQARQHQVRSIKQLTEQLVTMLDPDRKERFDEDAHLRRSIRLSIDATGTGSSCGSPSTSMPKPAASTGSGRSTSDPGGTGGPRPIPSSTTAASTFRPDLRRRTVHRGHRRPGRHGHHA